MPDPGQNAREDETMAGHASYVERILTGREIELKDGRTVKVDTVGDYEPWDPSVGIMSGSVSITTTDGEEYWVADDGSVYADGGAGDKLGETIDLLPDYD